MRRIMRLACLVLICIVPPAASTFSAEAAKESPKATSPQPEIAALEEAASRLRGLQFKRKVDYHVVERSAVEDLLRERLNEEFPPDKLGKLSIAYAKLGLIEKGVNLEDTILALYSEQLAAFYDPKKKQLYSIKGLPFSKEMQDVIMVHELTHVLQDQNFDLDALPLDIKTNDDLALAALSIVEGDATILCGQYAKEEASIGLRDLVASMSMSQKGLVEAPYVIRKNLMFPYSEGTRFVRGLLQEGGWKAVNRAFKDLPQSTEQILHPEKYSDKRDVPVPISLPDFSSLAGKKWELLEDNVLGELNTRVLFTEFLGSIRSLRPSKGWGGDRFRVYRAEGGDDTLLIWATAWDTQKDREEFVSYYRKALKKKYKGKDFSTVEGKDCVSLASPDLVIWLGWTEKTALVLEVPDDTVLAALFWEFLKAGGVARFTQHAPVAEAGNE